MNFEVATLLDMKNLGKLIASDVAPGQIWHVEGELGVGKTTLIQFILASFRCDRLSVKPDIFNL